MKKEWIILGTVAYFFVAGIFIPFFGDFPYADIFIGGDSADYSTAARHILQHATYSMDGIHPFFEREPAYSFFLAVLYGVFGIENLLAIFIAQAFLLYIATFFFCSELSKFTQSRVAGITFLMILSSGSVLHTVFIVYREIFGLSMLLLSAGFFLQALRRSTIESWIVAGFFQSVLILTLFSVFFLPLFTAIGCLFFARSRRVGIMVFLLSAYVPVSLWAMRNYQQTGHFRVIGNQRTAVMWYVRGEQAERLHGLEPLRCLYAEYVSRSWEGLSSACSFNALMHERWPGGFDRSKDYSTVAAEGRRKIFAHPVSYAWFSIVDSIELHIPFVGGGFSSIFNLYAALSGALLYLGVLIGVWRVWRTLHLLWILPILYNILVYCLTDATPRYLVPFLLFYAVFAGFGYDWLLAKVRKRS
jgi:hypothetical protein